MLGYEGIIKLGDHYCLGTGAAIPQIVVRLDSSSGYGGQIKTPLGDMGVGAPHTYDWSKQEGSIDLELNLDLYTGEIYPWLIDRQNFKDLTFKPRIGSNQFSSHAFWSSITLSASQASAVTSSISVMMPFPYSYGYGDKYITNKVGSGLFCLDSSIELERSHGVKDLVSGQDYIEVTSAGFGFTPNAVTAIVVKPSGGDNIYATLRAGTLSDYGFVIDLSSAIPSSGYKLSYLVARMDMLAAGDLPPPLNPGGTNLTPIPFWNTHIKDNDITKNFLNWDVSFTQEPVLFYGCNDSGSGTDPGPQAPLFLAMGPMTIGFTGTFIPVEEFTAASIPTIDPNAENGNADAPLVGDLKIYLGDTQFLWLKNIEMNSFSDNVSNESTIAPLSVDYSVYELG